MEVGDHEDAPNYKIAFAVFQIDMSAFCNRGRMTKLAHMTLYFVLIDCRSASVSLSGPVSAELLRVGKLSIIVRRADRCGSALRLSFIVSRQT